MAVVWRWNTSPGLEAMIVRHRLGHLCGYVSVPAEHALYGVDNDEKIDALNVHGGVTFTGEYDGEWWIGFDCAHVGDSPDVYTVDRVAVECERLAEELTAT